MKKIISLFSILFTMALVLTISLVTTKASSDIVNLASPDLSNKEYLGDGVYLVFKREQLEITYNVYSGNFILNGSLNYTYDIVLGGIWNYSNEAVKSFEYVSGSYTGDTYFIFGDFLSNQLLDFTNKQNIVNDLDNIGDFRKTILRFYYNANSTYNDYTFKIQLEQGIIASPYQTPIGALKQHTAIQNNKSYSVGYDDGELDGYNAGYNVGYDDGELDGYNAGYNVGLNDGYADGFNDALQTVIEIRNYLAFSNLDNITFLDRSQAGPNDRFFGFKIDNIDTYINQVSFFTTNSISSYNYLAPIDTVSSGMRANIKLVTDNGSIMYDFADMGYNENDSEYTFYNRFPSHEVKEIHISFLLIDGSVPNFTEFQQYLFDNTSLFINNEYYNDLFITRIKDIYYDYGYDDATLNYDDIIADLMLEIQTTYDFAYNLGQSYGRDVGYADGYNKGSSENIATSGFVGILSSAFIGVSTLLSIDLLPNISLGMIVAVPLVFGILFFILGKRKD